ASIDGYYVVQLAKRDVAGEGFSETEGHYTYGDVLNILRNYRYVITIDEVRAAGWPKLEQAKTARPDNRLTSLVTDVAPNITDIEATRDYYLGVGSDVSVYYNANAEVEITTNYPGLEAGATWAQKLELESDEDWIITNDDESAETHVTFEERDGVVVAIVPLTQNTDSRSREGNLTVRAGKLSRKVNITQEGCPYNRRRLVTVTGIPGLDVSQYGGYYSFMDGIKYDADGNPTGEIVDNHIIGLSKEANRNVDRNGLHFPIVPLYTGVKYFIPKKESDTEAKITRGSDVFQVSEEGDNWVVTLVNEDAIKRGEGRLSISSSLEGTPVTVEYPLFRTGIFHELKSSYAGLQAEESVKEGWYYYEVVRSGNVYILDRDLGAASNKGYAPGAVDYKKNTDAIGGFFKVNTSNWVLNKDNDTKRLRQDRQTITASLGLHNSGKGCFVPATETDLLSLDLNCGGVVSANAVNSSIAEGKIYFPKAGYYEGSDHKDMNRCKIWTRTYLGGTQGMSITSNEYGYWYRYFDDGKSTNNENRFSNIRMARGSNGLVPTDASVWRYMPLRLVWVDKDFNNPSGSSVEEEEQVVSGKMVIYFEDTQNWGTVKYHAWNVSTGGTTWGWNNLPTLTPVATKEGSKLYRVEVVPNNNAGILFKYADGDAKYQTQDYTNLKSLYDSGKTVIWLTQNGKDGDKYKVKLVDSGNVESLVTSNFGGGGGDDPTPTTTYTYGLKLGGETVSLTNNVLTDKVITNASTTIEVIEYAKTGSNTTTTYYNNKFNAPGLDKDVNFTTGSSSWALEAGTYTFTLNPTAKTLKVVKKTTPVVTYEITGSIWSDGGGWTKKSLTQSADNSNIWYLNDVVVKTGDFLIISNESSDNYYGGPDDSHKTISANGTTKITVTNESRKKDIAITAGTYSFTFNSSTKELTVTGSNSGGAVTIPTGTYRIYWKKGLHDNIDRPKIEFWDGISGNTTKFYTGEAGSYYYYDSNSATMHFHFLDSNGQNAYQQGGNWWQLNGDGDWEKIGSGGYSFYVDSYGDSCGKGLPSELK
ncbi:MAG: hypothetical protein K2H15_09245, partial [Muribaculaceae bacterium]|nr:hypothetical protein [Muribaculaceae bacterium]